MALRYVNDPRTIILCVVPANADITTSDALQMARNIDEKGIRTIGVFTKIDIMDKGTSARRMLMGQEVPLRLGYVGVKNRSQLDINNAMAVSDALDAEKEFFKTHPELSSLPQNLLGTRVLTSKLTKVMFTHIKHLLPEITREIRDKQHEVEDRLKDLGPAMPVHKNEKIQLLWNMITEFIATYKNTIGGKYSGRHQISREISGGAKIKLMFYNLYKEFSGPNYSATQSYTDFDIERALILHEGDTIPGFPSVDVFLYLISPKLSEIREPATDTINEVYFYLETLAQNIADRIFQRFPTMIGEIMEMVIMVLQRERDKAREVVEALIDAEQGYLFTNDQDYLQNRTDIIPQQ